MESVPAGCEPAGDGHSELRRFGDFELVEELGRGGMGVVYRARQSSLGRDVALKMLRLGSGNREENIERFKREAAAAAALGHPLIVAIHEIGEHDRQPYLVMELIEGPSLAEAIEHFHRTLRQQGGRADWKRAAAWMKGVADAVQHAHEHGIVHRDLKPTNILIDGADQPHVADFGLAKRIDQTSSLTMSGQFLGTPAYIAPEQIAGADSSGHSSDIYSLGAILYQILTGRPPFVAESLQEVLQKVLYADPSTPRVVEPSVPVDLETVCLKCLEKDPARRYGTAAELAQELERFLNGEAIVARPIGPLGRAAKWARRRPAVAALSGLSAILILTLLAGLAIVNVHTRTQHRVAERSLYTRNLLLASESLANGNLAVAREMLSRYRPDSPDRPDVIQTGWEWQYLWNKTRAQSKRMVGRMSNVVERLRISGDGRWLAAQDRDLTVVVWPLAGGPPAPLRIPDGRRALVFDPGSSSFLAGSSNSVLAFAPGSWDQPKTVASFPDPINAIAIHVPSRQLAASTRTRLYVFDLQHSHPIWEQPITNAATLEFSASGKWIAALAGMDEDQVLLLDAASGQITASTQDEMSRTVAGLGLGRFVFALDDSHLFLTHAGADLSASRFAVPSLDRQLRFQNDRTVLSDIELSRDGDRLYASGFDQQIHVFDAHSGAHQYSLLGHLDEVWSLVLSPDGRTLYSGAKDGSILEWDLARESVVDEFLFEGEARGAHISRDGRTFFRYSWNEIEIWETLSARLLRRDSIPEWLLQVGFNYLPSIFSDRTRFLVPTDGGDALIVDAANWNVIQTLPGTGLPATWWICRDEQFLVTADQEGTVRQWDIQANRTVLELPPWRPNSPGVWIPTLGPGSKVLYVWRASADHDDQIGRWDLEMGAQLPPIRIPEHTINHVVPSPDGHWLAVVSARNPAYLIDLRNPDKPHLLGRALNSFQTLEWFPDSSRLLAASSQGTIVVWSPDWRVQLLTVENPHPLPGAGIARWWGRFIPSEQTFVCASIHGIRLLRGAPEPAGAALQSFD